MSTVEHLAPSHKLKAPSAVVSVSSKAGESLPPCPLISVLMGVRDGEPYLKDAIESILNQTFGDFEFLIVDDASADRSPQIIEDYAKRDSRIRLIRQTAGGLTRSLNRGLKEARGEFIARMDADDVATRDRFAKQLAFLRSHPTHVAVGGEVMLIDPDGDRLGVRGHFQSHEAIDASLLQGQAGAMTHPCVMIRHDAMRQIGGYDESYPIVQDLDLYLRLAEVGKLANLPEVILYWRQHFKSSSHSKFKLHPQIKTKIVTNAFRRRGEHAPTFDESVLDSSELDEAWFYYLWAHLAIYGGHPKVAWKHLNNCQQIEGNSTRILKLRLTVLLGFIWKPGPQVLRFAFRKWKQSAGDAS